MKKWFTIMIILLHTIPAMAKHVAGGELFYEFLSHTGTKSTYRVTLRLFRDCLSNGPLLENETAVLGVYENSNLVLKSDLLRNGSVATISLNTAAFPCLVGNPVVCYQMATYATIIELEDNAVGYTLVRMGCCRIDQISNLSQSTNVGSTYVTKIPGTNTLGAGQHNSSPQFLIKDTALVCSSKKFQLDFGAQDPDNDSLTFSFCDAYATPGGAGNGTSITPPAALSLTSLPYGNPYNGSMPLGSRVSIDGRTGLISGIAPPSGKYVVNVCITEWRNGEPFTQHRKDFILKVQDCDLIEADLPDRTIKCDNFNAHFENGSTSSSIISYLWNFGNPSSPNNTSTDPTPDHIYTDTGRYITSLTITGPKGCVGTDSTVVLVYPGFSAGFTVQGTCIINPYQFTDTTYTKYGTVNSWRWDFGDTGTDADTSLLKNPSYKYGSSGNKMVSLVATSSKGCVDTASRTISALDKPLLQLAFKDTLICSIDSLPLQVYGSGTFSWTPVNRMLNPNTANPLVFPITTTKYIVTANLSGCINTDTVTVNVLDSINVILRDSTVCTLDTFHLQPVSQALGYRWQASTGEAVSSIKFPLVQPRVNTVYTVFANLGHCKDTASASFKTVPYPQVNAGNDTSICFNSRAQLHAQVKASSVRWSPAGSLTSAISLNPVAAPSRTTSYLLTVSDTLGCPKQVSDTVIVTVLPPVRVNAGNDTSVVANQQLQLQPVVSDATRYLWSPAFGIADVNVLNAIVVLGDDVDSVHYKLTAFNQAGCSNADDIVVHVFKTAPDLFVPSAFTPNGDGRNDIFKPVPVGITRLNYFRVYNRLGQLLYATSEFGKGWDGTFNGVKQPSGTYVFAAEGVDYKGKSVFRKGTCVLIR